LTKENAASKNFLLTVRDANLIYILIFNSFYSIVSIASRTRRDAMDIKALFMQVAIGEHERDYHINIPLPVIVMGNE
jgi:hypothetical protein